MDTTISRKIANLAVLFLLGAFLVGTSGFDLLPDMGVFNGKRFLQVVTLLLIPLVVLLNRPLREEFGNQQRRIPVWVLISLLLVMIIGVVSAMRFEQPGYGLLEVAMPALLIIAVLSIAASRSLAGEGFDRLAILIIIAISVMVLVTEAMGMLVAWGQGLEFSFNRMLIRFTHPRFYNQLQTYSIPLIVTLPFIFSTRKLLRLSAVVLLGFQWCLVLMSGGRGTFVSVLVALTVTAFVFPAIRRSWLVLHLSGILLSVLLFLGVSQVQQGVERQQGKFLKESVGRSLLDSTGRNDMWARSVAQAKESPLLGSGPARYSCEAPLTLPSHPHNFLMRILSEMGWIAFFLVVMVCGWLGWKLLLNSRRTSDSGDTQAVLTAMLFCSVLAGAIHAFVSGVLIMPASQMITVLAGAWCLGRFNPTASSKSGASIPVIAVLGTSILLASVVVTFSARELEQMEVRTQTLRKTTFYMPRYWHFGRSCNYSYENS